MGTFFFVFEKKSLFFEKKISLSLFMFGIRTNDSNLCPLRTSPVVKSVLGKMALPKRMTLVLSLSCLVVGSVLPLLSSLLSPQ